MKRSVSVLSAVALSSLFAGTAHAALTHVSGYVCSTSYTRQSNLQLGHQGFVGVSVFSGPACTGSNLGTFYYLGQNASATGYQYSEAERLQLFDQAQQVQRRLVAARMLLHRFQQQLPQECPVPLLLVMWHRRTLHAAC